MNTNDLQPTVIRTERGLTVDGARLTLSTLLDHLKAGWPPKLVKDWFDLTDQQMNAVLAYIAAQQNQMLLLTNNRNNHCQPSSSQ